MSKSMLSSAYFYNIFRLIEDLPNNALLWRCNIGHFEHRVAVFFSIDFGCLMFAYAIVERGDIFIEQILTHQQSHYSEPG